MKYRALVTFAGVEVSMAMGEVKEVPEPIAKDLLNAKYIEKAEGENNVQSKVSQAGKRKRTK